MSGKKNKELKVSDRVGEVLKTLLSRIENEELRITFGAQDYAALVSGGAVEFHDGDGHKFCIVLNDIGYPAMRRAIDESEASSMRCPNCHRNFHGKHFLLDDEQLCSETCVAAHLMKKSKVEVRNG